MLLLVKHHSRCCCAGISQTCLVTSKFIASEPDRPPPLMRVGLTQSVASLQRRDQGPMRGREFCLQTATSTYLTFQLLPPPRISNFPVPTTSLCKHTFHWLFLTRPRLTEESGVICFVHRTGLQTKEYRQLLEGRKGKKIYSPFKISNCDNTLTLVQ